MNLPDRPPDPLPPGGLVDMTRTDGRYCPAPKADACNVLARYAFAWSDFIRDGKGWNGITKEELGEAFEGIGFHLGDGVAYDDDQASGDAAA